MSLELTSSALAELRRILTAPAESAPLERMVAEVGAEETAKGREFGVSYPALGMCIFTTCTPSKAQRVLRAIYKIAEINERYAEVKISELDAADEILPLFDRIERNSKSFEVFTITRRVWDYIDAQLDELIEELETEANASESEKVTTSDGRYVVNLATGQVEISPEIPGAIANLMPRLTVLGGCVVTMQCEDVPEGSEDAARVEAEAGKRNANEVMEILGIREVQNA